MKNRIKKLRLERDVSQTELAEALKTSRQAISNYEKGLREPKIDTFVILADYLNVSAPYLMGFDE
ncbi:hypothetical protein [Latilactobacillus phage TMW 1.706 P1]|uniref:HTH cro/C1-type domain-containing protein n=1 Tax=Latilactobacillus curvatus JCM 1096 = DSM 20019 TaxID=1293592 RepID=A0AAJ0LDS3_LATCU|nr:helix-turn-helix transcriptional regulator [Latilactobacillus curvatus]WCZ54836.1 hypothetical protein [Latilactobacillus phage TMW 1.706 P1]KRK90386.1 hypothetical protein FC08_GL001543 [Latilactobacillus curvatus JCM 1096 = DSM 20019]MCT3531287.1 XRE family transcriptional regulator [Latilactobacillus curvatus]MDG2988161.1 helix-turn-helix domain-containing protein [Latilactobacillus curvatus]QAS49583.1 helix-turn-helix domain-containing protein [Latilactobacillus curvatus JCM 1096 = DSM 